jgi:predicted transcriptional regulator of viral defense system
MIRGPRERFDTPPDLRAARRAARQHGLIRYRQLVHCGLDADAIMRRVRKGWLHRVHHGVYAVGYAPQTLHAHFMAAVLAGGDDASLSHWSSSALAELVRWDGRTIEVTVRGSGGRAREGIHFHRARSLDQRDTTRIHGIPCTTPARAILEIAPQVSDRRLKRLVRKAQAEKLASVRQFEAMLGRANGHAATQRIAAIIATGAAPTYSGDEDAVVDLVLAAGFEHPEVNQRLVVGPETDRTPYFPDLRWPAQRLILEIDSAWHDGPLALASSPHACAPPARLAGDSSLRAVVRPLVQYAEPYLGRAVHRANPA